MSDPSGIYSLASGGVYPTIQGEGALLGTPMVFIRLAGCRVNCFMCDTDYRVASRASAAEIADRVASASASSGAPLGVRWAWVTGGEPADRDLGPLIVALKARGLCVAVATSGHRPIPPRWASGIDWLSVSPHDPAEWVVRQGQELKLVPGLAGRDLEDFAPLLDPTAVAFGHYFVQPCHGLPQTVGQCVEFVRRDPRFRLGVQAQYQWGLE